MGQRRRIHSMSTSRLLAKIEPDDIALPGVPLGRPSNHHRGLVVETAKTTYQSKCKLRQVATTLNV